MRLRKFVDGIDVSSHTYRFLVAVAIGMVAFLIFLKCEINQSYNVDDIPAQENKSEVSHSSYLREMEY